jgi:hypothetical protein
MPSFLFYVKAFLTGWVASKQRKEILLLEGHKEKLSCFKIDVRGICTVDCAIEDSKWSE